MQGEDRVILGNAGGEGTGVFARGQDAYRARGNEIRLPARGKTEGAGEVLAFVRGRPPVSRQVIWSGERNTVELEFPDCIELPVTIWILDEAFERQQRKVARQLVATNEMYQSERMGIRLSDREFVDASGHAGVEEYLSFSVSKTSALVEEIGFRRGRLNLYYVDVVKGESGSYSSGNGRTASFYDRDPETPVKIIVMGKRVTPDLLAHELGHVFNLRHIDDLDQNGVKDDGGEWVIRPHSFGPSNVMHPASRHRRFLTEGQVYRAHFHASSQLNAVYQLRGPASDERPQRVIHPCEGDETSPALHRRIWRDGARPAAGVVPTLPAPLQLWLARDCDVDAGRALTERILAKAGELERPLLDAFLHGPDKKLVDEFKRHASAQASALAKALDEFGHVHMERAISALAVMRSKAALPHLRQLAADEHHPLHRTAMLALRDYA